MMFKGATCFIERKKGKANMKPPLGQTKWRLSLVALTLCTILCSGCGLFNNAPVIISLEAERDSIGVSDSLEVRCIATDEDGDSLTWAWSTTGGTFSGAGAVVTWTAPDTSGTYVITVTVTDGRGGEATMQLTTEVLANRPPVIESVVAEREVVLENESTPIECIAYDPDGDELTYKWTASGGEFSGQGPAVVWTAPGSCTTHTITVTVTDGRGGEASQETSIRERKPG